MEKPVIVISKVHEILESAITINSFFEVGVDTPMEEILESTKKIFVDANLLGPDEIEYQMEILNEAYKLVKSLRMDYLNN